MTGKEKKTVKKEKGKRGRTAGAGKTSAYTLNTPLVIDYIYFRAWPVDMRGRMQDIRTEADFLIANGLSVKSYQSLYNIRKIKGFEEAVEAEKARVQRRRLEIADSGLIKRAQGMTVKKEQLDRIGRVHNLKEELPPDTAACREIYKIHGEYVDNVNHSGSIAITQDKIRKIAEKAGEDNDS